MGCTESSEQVVTPKNDNRQQPQQQQQQMQMQQQQQQMQMQMMGPAATQVVMIQQQPMMQQNPMMMQYVQQMQMGMPNYYMTDPYIQQQYMMQQQYLMYLQQQGPVQAVEGGGYVDAPPAKEFGTDDGDCDIPIREIFEWCMMEPECSVDVELFANTLIWYYKQMPEFQADPPNEDKDTKAKHMRHFIDLEPNQSNYEGHSKNGVAHGIGFIYAPRKVGRYVGTFVNGVRHGYGISHHCFAYGDTYYIGEFQNGEPHGYGKRVAGNFDDYITKEGWWEYGSIVPAKRVTEPQRQANLKVWSDRQDMLLGQHAAFKQALAAKIASEEQRANMQMEMWHQKRDMERPTEKPFIRKHIVDVITEMGSTIENIIAGNMYKDIGDNFQTKEAFDEETVNIWAYFHQHIMQSPNMNRYDEKDKDSKNHGMWVPRLMPVGDYDKSPLEGDEEDEEGME